jgi:hypothetical protein
MKHDIQELIQFIQEVLLEAKPAEILSKTSQDIKDRSHSRPARLSRVDRANGIWNYQVPGKKSTYLVRIKLTDPNAKQFNDSDILITCNCKFFRWQGPEHWAKVDKYLYQNPAGSASQPVIRDPEGVKRICKHCVSALELAKNIVL